jgi:predicted CopG family antitoxin
MEEPILPRVGYKTICVTEDVYRYIQKKAKETDQSIPEYITNCIEKEKSLKGER